MATGKFTPLDEHLKDVAAKARKFAQHLQSGDWADVAGTWHDLGKYAPDFQSYIRKVSCFDAEAYIETSPGKVNHSAAGALHALATLDRTRGTLLAYLIAGHHAGLPDYHSGDSGTGLSLSQISHTKDDRYRAALGARIPDTILRAAPPNLNVLRGLTGTALSLWVRMLFSCLVDADFLDTERFMDPEKFASRGHYPTLGALRQQYDDYMGAFASSADAHTPVNQLRAEILENCRRKAIEPPGVYSLTVPTGGGKTLASLGFALHHARQRASETAVDLRHPLHQHHRTNGRCLPQMPSVPIP